MTREIQMRLGWVKLYQETKDAGYVCRRCGISRPTLRKWAVRYAASGVEGLKSLSKRPHHVPNTKVGATEAHLILELRQQRHLGARRIQNELKRLHNLSLALATIHKPLQRHRVKPVVRKRRKRILPAMLVRFLVIEFRWIPVKSVQG